MEKGFILHITNDYCGSAVYGHLIKEIDILGIPQVVYSPIRDLELSGRNEISFSCKYSKIIYSHILSKNFDRIFYKSKILKIVKDIESKVDLTKIDLIHAHTWYSDGGAAFELYKKYKIPYILAVRNSDLNLFLKYLIHERSYGKKILLQANKIIAISAVYKQRLIAHRNLSDVKEAIRDKVIIVPNGVDAYWISEKVSSKKMILDNKNIQLLYIGNFNYGKNVFNLINAVKQLNDKSPFKIRLTMIGGKGSDEKRVLAAISGNYDFNYVGKIYKLPQLKAYFQQSDVFVMPSKAETFGLVYIEALLQGLPILYTKNEGIDGFYDDSIGEKIENTSIEEIANKIQILIENHDLYNFDIKLFSENHDWKNIAKDYLKLYNNNNQ